MLTDHQNASSGPPGGAASGLSVRELLDLIREDYVTHDRNWALPVPHAVIVQRVGAWRLGLPRGVRRKSVSLFTGLYIGWFATSMDRDPRLDAPWPEGQDPQSRRNRHRSGRQHRRWMHDLSRGDDGHATRGSGAPRIGTGVEMSVRAVPTVRSLWAMARESARTQSSSLMFLPALPCPPCPLVECRRKVGASRKRQFATMPRQMVRRNRWWSASGRGSSRRGLCPIGRDRTGRHSRRGRA